MNTKSLAKSYRFFGVVFVCVAMLGATGCITKPGPKAPPPAPPVDTGTTPPAPRVEGEKLDLAPVYFDYDKFNIGDQAAATLRSNAEWMKKNADYDIVIEGHCDNRGSDQYNLALGERRAHSVRQYLMQLGIDGNRLSTRSYGESRPAVPNARTESEHSKNRRAEFVGVKAR